MIFGNKIIIYLDVISYEDDPVIRYIAVDVSDNYPYYKRLVRNDDDETHVIEGKEKVYIVKGIFDRKRALQLAIDHDENRYQTYRYNE